MTEIPKIKRHRDPKFLKWIKGHPCIDCQNPETVAHHILKHTDSGKGLKPSDYCTVPLCHAHHMDIHEGRKPEKPLTLAGGYVFAYLESKGEYAKMNNIMGYIGELIKEVDHDSDKLH